MSDKSAMGKSGAPTGMGAAGVPLSPEFMAKQSSAQSFGNTMNAIQTGQKINDYQAPGSNMAQAPQMSFGPQRGFQPSQQSQGFQPLSLTDFLGSLGARNVG